MSKTRLLTSVATLGVGAALALGPAAAAAQEIVGLITKTNTNPFFVKMKEGAEAKADELGVELRRPSPASTTATTRARSPRSRT